MMKRLVLSVVCGVICATAVVAEEQASPSAGKLPRTSAQRKRDLRQREGTKFIEQKGRFQISGDRVLFVPLNGNDDTSLRVLENLMLERVLENLNESQAERIWNVSGVLTEFRTGNYLLLSKAIVENRDAAESGQ